jgi:hypothetical protein
VWVPGESIAGGDERGIPHAPDRADSQETPRFAPQDRHMSAATITPAHNGDRGRPSACPPPRRCSADPAMVARSGWDLHLAHHAVRRRPLGAQRWDPGVQVAGRRAEHARPRDGNGVGATAAHPGAAHGAHPDGRTLLRTGRVGQASPAGRPVVVQTSCGPTSCSSGSGMPPRPERASGGRSSTSCSTTRGCSWPLAGMVALCMVVVTSFRASRAALRYESWHLLHLYAYLGVGAGPAAPTLDRPGLRRQPRRDRLLVDPLGRGDRLHAHLAGRPADLADDAGTDSSSSGSTPRAPASRRSSSAVVTWTGSPSAPGSSSSGGFSATPAPLAPTPTRCPPHPTAVPCGSPAAHLGDGVRRARQPQARLSGDD